MDIERKTLIRQIKNSVPTVSNLAANIHEIDKFVKVQELIIELSSIGFDGEINVVVNVFRDYFHPIILSTLSFEIDFIRVVEPVLRTPKIPIHASKVFSERHMMSRAFAYNSILNKMIDPTDIEKKIGEILFIENSNNTTGLKNTNALKIALSTIQD